MRCPSDLGPCRALAVPPDQLTLGPQGCFLVPFRRVCALWRFTPLGSCSGPCYTKSKLLSGFCSSCLGPGVFRCTSSLRTCRGAAVPSPTVTTPGLEILLEPRSCPAHSALSWVPLCHAGSCLLSSGGLCGWPAVCPGAALATLRCAAQEEQCSGSRLSYLLQSQFLHRVLIYVSPTATTRVQVFLQLTLRTGATPRCQLLETDCRETCSSTRSTFLVTQWSLISC